MATSNIASKPVVSTEKKPVTSRIGRKPVVIPAGITATLVNNVLTVKGPKGSATVDLHAFVNVIVDGPSISVSPASTQQVITGARKKLFRAIVGTTRANIFNAIHGVAEGYERKLTLVGVGYRAQAKGKVLSLSLGFSHPTDFDIPVGVVIETPTQTEVIIKGVSKELVGFVASEIRSIRPPEPYKGKGIRYANEVIELKETKKK